MAALEGRLVRRAERREGLFGEVVAPAQVRCHGADLVGGEAENRSGSCEAVGLGARREGRRARCGEDEERCGRVAHYWRRVARRSEWLKPVATRRCRGRES